MVVETRDAGVQVGLKQIQLMKQVHAIQENIQANQLKEQAIQEALVREEITDNLKKDLHAKYQIEL